MGFKINILLQFSIRVVVPHYLALRLKLQIFIQTIDDCNGLFQKISTPPMDDTELSTQKIQDFQEAQ